MNKLFLGLVGAAALWSAVAMPARADWQFTEWGMRKDEFKQVSPVELDTVENFCKELVHSVSEVGTSPEYLSSNWKAGRFKFANCYTFGENNSLDGIHLNLIDGNSSKVLLDALQAKYGAPVSSTRVEWMNMTINKWHTETNLIVYLQKSTPKGIVTRVSYYDVKPVLEQQSKL